MASSNDLTMSFIVSGRSIESVDRTLARDRSVNNSIQVFISFAEEDKVVKDELRRSLSVLEAEKKIKLWDRGDLLGAQRSQKFICEKFEQSRIILLLISPDFMADDGFCKSEMAMAMEKLELGILHVVLVRLRSTYMGGSNLQDLTWLPEKLVTQSADKEAAFMEIFEGVAKICAGIRRSDAWDRQIEADILAGRFEELANIAINSTRAGESKPLPTHE
jgi:hypothetical protein